MNLYIPAENVVWIQLVFYVLHVLKIRLIEITITKWRQAWEAGVAIVEMLKRGKKILSVIFTLLVVRLVKFPYKSSV